MQLTTCSDCGESKPLSAFQWRKDNKKYRTQCESCRHFGNTRRLYGIDRKAYEAMREAQGFKCAICYAYDEEKHLHIDHCHTTGKVRGLLCLACNHMLGKARDNPETLRRAASYLET